MVAEPDKKPKAIAIVEAMQAAARSRKKTAPEPEPPEEEPVEPTQLQLPFPWGEEVRGAPNILLRSAIFAVVRPGQRRWYKQEQICSLDGYTIIYTGEQLDQGDLDIWQQAVHLCKHDLGNYVLCSKKRLLRDLGRSDGKENKLWLMRGLDRLVAASAKLIDTCAGTREDPRSLNENMLGYMMDGDRLMLRVSAKWAAFFIRDSYTLIDWQRRLAIPTRSQLTKWLHDFYSSHAAPYPMKVETVRDLCGSKTTDINRFRANLREALDELADEQIGLLTSWNIDQKSDLVTVQKNASSAQNRHLLRRITSVKAKRRNQSVGG